MSPANEKMQNIETNKNYKDLFLLGFIVFCFYLFLWFLEDLGQNLGQKTWQHELPSDNRKNKNILHVIVQKYIYSVPLFKLNV